MTLPNYINYYNRPNHFLEFSWYSKEYWFSSAECTCIPYVLDYQENCVRVLREEERQTDPRLHPITYVYRLNELDKIVILSYQLQQRYVIHPVLLELHKRKMILTPNNFRRYSNVRKCTTTRTD